MELLGRPIDESTTEARLDARAEDRAQRWRDDYGTDLRDTAGVLALVALSCSSTATASTGSIAEVVLLHFRLAAREWVMIQSLKLSSRSSAGTCHLV